MEFIDKSKFVFLALNKNVETFVIYVVTLSATSTLAIGVHFSCQAQIKLLPTDKATIKVLSKYLDYTDVIIYNLIIELSKNTNMNKYTIKLVEDKKLPYGLIYILWPVELEILKTYIKTNLKTEFIQPFIWSFKSPTDVPIVFN